MKKYFLLLSSFIVLVLSFVNSWYIGWLLDTFFIFAFIPSILLFITYIICFKFSIKKITKDKSIINIITICILIINAILIIFFPFEVAKTNLELKLYNDEREEIIEMIKNKDLVADEHGNAKLPKDLKKTSTSGEISIYQNDENGQVIGFWIFRGMLSGSTELIYSSNGEELIRKNEAISSITSIEKLKDNWYYVITDY